MPLSPAIDLRADSPAPPLGLMSIELVRAAFEYASTRLAHPSHAPRGDGHPVVIFPGLGTDGRCVEPLRAFCEEAGYTAHEWGRGRNNGPQGDVDAWLQALADHVLRLAEPGEDGMSLIGWSLGGIYARELAKIMPGRVRQVITIGTPFAGTVRSTNVGLVYRLLNGRPAEIDDALSVRLATAPDVPTTSIYSRSDGIVAWEACVQRGPGRHVESIEVDGSHCGLGWNREVLSIVADRLGQPPGRWRAYARACQ